MLCRQTSATNCVCSSSLRSACAQALHGYLHPYGSPNSQPKACKGFVGGWLVHARVIPAGQEARASLCGTITPILRKLSAVRCTCPQGCLTDFASLASLSRRCTSVVSLMTADLSLAASLLWTVSVSRSPLSSPTERHRCLMRSPRICWSLHCRPRLRAHARALTKRPSSF